jgi:hypothetical protein
MISAGVQNGFSQTTGSSNLTITLHRRVKQSCELLQKGTLLFEGQYASVLVEGVAGQIYSPELGRDDFIGYPPGTPQKPVKLAQKSGFRMKSVLDAAVSDAPKVVGLEKASNCPSLEEVLPTAEQDRIEHRHHIQSKLFHPGIDGVSPLRP